jgi:dTDP-4-amino-4,6-dideoxygalactose transaminase
MQAASGAGTLCFTSADTLEAITPATRAVMPVLYGGRAVDLTAISTKLAEQDITIIEDAAHAFGSRGGGPANRVHRGAHRPFRAVQLRRAHR